MVQRLWALLAAPKALGAGRAGKQGAAHILHKADTRPAGATRQRHPATCRACKRRMQVWSCEKRAMQDGAASRRVAVNTSVAVRHQPLHRHVALVAANR